MFPFAWLDHGPLDVDGLDKCAEVFLWFARDGAPDPLGYFHGWGERWAYFGSAGDSYDAAIFYTYGAGEEGAAGVR